MGCKATSRSKCVQAETAYMDYISCQQNADLQRTSLQHACFFVPVFSLYTFTPSCPLLVGTVTLRYIHVCSLYLKLCNIIRLLLFIPNNWLMETFKWNLVPYHIFQWNSHGEIVKFPLFTLVNAPKPCVTSVLFFIPSNCFQQVTGKYCNKIRLVSRLYLLKTCAVVIL